jgi:hypothetical protein
MMMRHLGPIARTDRVLEPSAGRGDIADRIRDAVRELVVVEPHPVLAGLLREKGYAPVVRRFEEFDSADLFDKVVMNPPFASGVDMLHVRRAFGLLCGGGTLVALMNDGDAPGDGTPEQRNQFAAWLMGERQIASIRVERLDPALLLSAENFRPSSTRIKLLTIRKRL